MTVIMPCYIVTEQLIELTKNAVDSFGDVQLIIVDNASPIGGGLLRSLADVYVRNNENLGYAKAVNQGLCLAHDPFIAIANNDVRVSPNWQSVAHEVFVEPNTYSCHFRMTDYDVPFEYGNSVLYEGKERWCTSSFFVIKSSNPLLYDEEYLNSYDDWDYWHTVRSMGLKTAYTDKSCYQHLHSTTQQLIPKRSENDKRNHEYFRQKWGEYPEDLFTQLYPDQMETPYWEGFICH